jgi:hypothetical protein
VTFTITVNCVNDAPNAANDSFAGFGNTELRVDLPANTTPTVVRTTASGHGVLDNDSDPVEGDPIAITSVAGCADGVAPFDCTFADGTLHLNANGSFSFVPSPGVTSTSFQYTVSDTPACGAPASDTATVTLTFSPVIWYVNGSAAPGGNGTSVAPFNSFTSLNGAGGLGDVDGPGDIIFVHDSNVSGSIGLEANQHLIGEGVGLTVSSYTLVPAGTKPRIFSAGDAVTVNNVAGTEIAGLELSSSAGSGIDVTSSGISAAAASIHDNLISSAGTEGIDVNVGGLGGTVVNVNDTGIRSTGNGLDVLGTAGSAAVSYTNGTVLSTAGTGIRMDGMGSGNLFVTGLSNVTIDGNTAGDGVNLVSVKFDATPGGSFDTVSGGAIVVGTSGNPVGGSGIVMSGVSGDYAIGSLSSFAGTGAAFAVAGSGLFTGSAGMRVSNSGGGTLNAPSNAALSVSNTTIGAANLRFTTVSSGGGTNGIVLNNTGSAGGLVVTGTGSAGTGGTVQNNTADAVSLTSTSNVSLSFMNIKQSGESGILGSSVAGLSLINCAITNNGNDSADEGVMVTNLTGTAAFTNTTVSGSAHNNVFIDNAAGNLASLTVSGSTFSNNGAAFGANGFLLQARSTATVSTISITGSTFTGAPSDGLLIQAADTATITSATVSGCTVTDNGVGMNFTQSNAANITVKVLNNLTITGSQLAAINVFSSSGSTGGTFNARIQGNTIGNAGVAVSGSAFGSGVRVIIQGQTRGIVLVDANTVRQTPFSRGMDIEGLSVPGLDVTITGNDVDPQDASGFPLAAIFVSADNLGPGGLVRADIRNNIVPAASNTFDYPDFDGTGDNLRYEELSGATAQLVDTPPASATATAQLQSTNTGSASANPGVALIAGPLLTPP